MAPPRILAVMILALGLLFPAGRAWCGATAMTATPDQLEALFVQRLVGYVSWPEPAAEQDGPVVVAATDARRLRPYFSKASDRFKLVQWPCDSCRVLVINGASDRDAAAIFERVKDRPVLTVGRGDEAMRLGAVIGLMRVGDHIRLQVNIRAASRAGLTISSRLLSIVSIYAGKYD